MPRHTGAMDSLDPLSLALAPPANETPEQQLQRLKKEAEARRVSNEIDQKLKADAAAFKKTKKDVRLLLLGQSESGKSTTLKNFQLTYARKAWIQERDSWRAVVQLNLVRSINTILHVLSEEMARGRGDATSIQFTTTHQLLKLRLAPLIHVEQELQRRLGAGSFEEVAGPHNLGAATHSDASKPSLARASSRSQEFFVRNNNSWKNLYNRFPSHSSSPSRNQDQDEVASIISSCKDDMKSLWSDSVINQLLDQSLIKLPESAEFFLDGIERIGTSDYSPTDDDIIRARLRTVGVQEYRLDLNDKNSNWYIYDVGGSQTQRAAWLPYFEDCNAIIFLAPISCFDETLAENSTINRLQDSFTLWGSICASPLLSKVTLIIFLNKMDILDRKLSSGTKVCDYLPTYEGRENESTAFAKYLREQFRDVLKKSSRVNRPFYGYITSVIDTEATRKTISSVHDGILRESLRKAELI